MPVTPPAPEDPFAAVRERAADVPRPERDWGDGPRERWPVALLVVLTVAGVALGFTWTDAPERPESGISITFSTETEIETESEPEPVSSGFGDGGPLTEPQNLAAALRASGELVGSGRLVHLRVAAENVQAEWRVDATTQRRTLAERDGRLRVVGEDWRDDDPAIDVADIRPRALVRLAERAGGPVDYFLLDPEERTWSAYTVDGRRVEAALDGSAP